MSTGTAETRSGGFSDGEPEWCGQCDKRTRLIDRDGILHRCRCNPRSHLQLTQYKKCPVCQADVYEWKMRTHIIDVHGITEENQ